MTKEIWKDVLGYERLYQVSNLGRVKSLERLVKSRDELKRKVPEIILSQAVHKGYSTVSLFKNCKGKTRKVYRLVLESFLGPCPEGMEGCHSDGNSQNNKLENLRWDTRLSNMRDQIKHGTHHKLATTHCPRKHELVEPNLILSAKPRRKCLACNRAGSFIRNRGGVTMHAPELQKLADEYYRRIMNDTTNQPEHTEDDKSLNPREEDDDYDANAVAGVGKRNSFISRRYKEASESQL